MALDKNLKELIVLADQIAGLESKLKEKRDKRNRLALKLLYTGKYSFRTIGKYAGFANTYLTQLKKRSNA